VDARSNEIPAVRDLLKTFADLAGAVITIDAYAKRHCAGHPGPARRLRDDRQGQHARPLQAAEEAAMEKPSRLSRP
jgi:hypothetical protein